MRDEGSTCCFHTKHLTEIHALVNTFFSMHFQVPCTFITTRPTTQKKVRKESERSMVKNMLSDCYFFVARSNARHFDDRSTCCFHMKLLAKFNVFVSVYFFCFISMSVSHSSQPHQRKLSEASQRSMVKNMLGELCFVFRGRSYYERFHCST